MAAQPSELGLGEAQVSMEWALSEHEAHGWDLPPFDEELAYTVFGESLMMLFRDEVRYLEQVPDTDDEVASCGRPRVLRAEVPATVRTVGLSSNGVLIVDVLQDGSGSRIVTFSDFDSFDDWKGHEANPWGTSLVGPAGPAVDAEVAAQGLEWMEGDVAEERRVAFGLSPLSDGLGRPVVDGTHEVALGGHFELSSGTLLTATAVEVR